MHSSVIIPRRSFLKSMKPVLIHLEQWFVVKLWILKEQLTPFKTDKSIQDQITLFNPFKKIHLKDVENTKIHTVLFFTLDQKIFRCTSSHGKFARKLMLYLSVFSMWVNTASVSILSYHTCWAKAFHYFYFYLKIQGNKSQSAGI